MGWRLKLSLVGPVLATGLYALFSDTRWRGGWASTLDIVTGATVLTGPVVASLAAGLHLGVVRLRPISESAAGGWRVPYRSAVDGWVIGLVAYAVTAVVAFGCTIAIPHGGPVQWWGLLAGVLVLALAALVGVLCAHQVPSPITVAAVGPALFVLGALGPAPLPEVLRFGPAGSLTGLRLDLEVHLARFAAVAALCLCAVVAVAPWRRHRTRLLPAAVAAVTVTVLAGSAVFATGTGGRLERSDERASACAGRAPVVCVLPSHRRYLDGVRRSVDDAAPLFADAGVRLPERYEEGPGDGSVSEGSGVFYVDTYRTDTSLHDAVRLLVRPADCPQWSSVEGPPYAAFDAEQLMVEWAVARAGQRPQAFNADMERWIEHIDDEATTAWVVGTFTLLGSCDFERIALPWE
jgi:hypothetical protein